jgi:hypothetical protein
MKKKVTKQKYKAREMPRGKKICVVCQKEVDGAPIKEDFIIKGLRKIKQVFKASTGNRLLVCHNCVQTATKKRQDFEKTLLTYLGLGGIILVIMLTFAILSGGSLVSLLQSILFLVFLIVLLAALSLFNYFPSFEGYEVAKKQKQKQKK